MRLAALALPLVAACSTAEPECPTRNLSASQLHDRFLACMNERAASVNRDADDGDDIAECFTVARCGR